MSEETATPEEDAPDSAESAAEGAADAGSAEGAADTGAPAHSPDPEDQAQNVRAGTDTAGADSEAAGADDAAAEIGSEVEAVDGSGDAAVVADDSPAEEKPKVKPAVPGADLEPIALESDENLSAEERARIEAEAEEEQARREAELAAENADEDFPVREPAKLEKDARFRATGKRKSAIARVILLPGSGQITVNGRDIEEYFPRALSRTMVRQPLVATGYGSSLDVRVRVHGGGVSGQASAVRHGVARALTEIDSELRGDLKRRGYLTRDARVKERRKAGLKKARKRPQFSKR